MGDERLNHLMLMSVEKELVKSFDLDELTTLHTCDHTTILFSIKYPGPPGETNDPTNRLNSERRRLRAKSRNPSHSPQPESRSNKQPQEHLAVGPALRILQLNAEGLSAAKRSLIEVLASQHSIDVICLQETHIGTEEAGRYIDGFDLLCYTLHTKHGRATYVRTNIAEANHLTTTNFSEIISIGGFHIVNVYKPPSANWDQQVLPTLPHPAIYVGDFNSHHPDWGYPAADNDGEALSDWASRNYLALIHDPKQRGTFHSARWNKDYCPDLCWVSSVNGTLYPTQILILDDSPHSQHRPSLIHIGLHLPIINSPRKMRWNFRKANWMKYSEALDRSIVTIPLQNITVDEAYNRFCGAIYKAAHTAIPRGYRPLYVPCLDGESAAHLQAYETSGDPEIADHLIESLTTARRKKWEETVAELTFTHSSRKCWSLIRCLGAAQKPPTQSRPTDYCKSRPR
ncbi:hypothetical protein SKAU_G00195630 [Synaphobranchus kaupii]|uniref:Endonuclease/exonuclease/phosphatase domain-containing protein n=1 Tax=Synaphobranchus kaupii TaxID=118154 RepID=A0A9Q1IWT2_SYNKA|nr:hypothetical protein SKAU_G00195630 [Synaphobranchus kaupii]